MAAVAGSTGGGYLGKLTGYCIRQDELAPMRMVPETRLSKVNNRIAFVFYRRLGITESRTCNKRQEMNEHSFHETQLLHEGNMQVVRNRLQKAPPVARNGNEVAAVVHHYTNRFAVEARKFPENIVDHEFPLPRLIADNEVAVVSKLMVEIDIIPAHMGYGI
jgi:hypothetical protein